MNLGLIVAILSPLIFGAVNIYDKYVVSRKVANTHSYAVLSGINNILFGLVLIFFLTWEVKAYSLIFPILAGIFSAGCYYLYFYIMKDSDASYVIGFAYLFPIVVAILSFVLLNERLSVMSYFAISLILLGIVLLSIRAKKIKLTLLIVPLIFYIILTGSYEFLIKVATLNISFMQGLAITTFTSGIFMTFGIFHKKTRIGFRKEIKNFKWSFFGEIFTLIAVFTLYFAVSILPVTIVASIASTQPLIVLIFERFMHSKIGKMTQDTMLLPKLGAILLIVIGVILLSFVNS